MANLSTILSNVSSGGATASSEKNYIRAPDQSSSLWVASGAGIAVSTETSVANLPEAATKTSAIKIQRASGSDYVRYRFTLDSNDYSRKFKLAFAMKYAGTLGDYTVTAFSNTASDYTGSSTQLTLQTSSLGPLFTNFATTFDVPGSTAPYIEIRINGISGTSPLYISGFIVGPGPVFQGSVISDWQSYTPVINGITTSAIAGRYRRVGSTMEIEASFTASGASTATISVRIPSGFTIDTTALSTTGGVPTLGSATARIASVNYVGVLNYANAVSVLATSGTANWWGDTAATPGTWANGSLASFNFSVPIAEWSGGGTLLLASSATVEYVYNSSVTTADDTTSFASGAAGALIQNFAPAGTTGVVKSVQFQYPVQSDDVVTLETDSGTGGLYWVPMDQRLGGFSSNDAGTTRYGNQLTPVSSTRFDVYFYSAIPSKGAWSAVNTWRWRVRKAKAGAPAGIDVSASSSGGTTYTEKTGTYTAVTGDNLLANTSGGAFTITLPSSPSVGANVTIFDARNTWATNNLTVARNGSNILSSATDLTANVSNSWLRLIYVGGTVGWNVYT